MRHLMSPLDLSMEEINSILDLASDIENTPLNMRMSVMIRDLPPYFMSQVPVHALVSKQQ